MGGGGENQDAAQTGLFQSILQVMTAWKEIDAEPEPPAPEPIKPKLAA